MPPMDKVWYEKSRVESIDLKVPEFKNKGRELDN